MSYIVERRYPTVISALLGFTCLGILYFLRPGPSDLLKDVLSATVNVGAISVGFLATALTLFYALADKEIVKSLKQIKRPNSTVYDDVLRYMVNAITIALVLTLFCIISIFFSSTKVTVLYYSLTACWAFLLSYSSLSLLRVIHILSTLLK